MPPQPNSPEVFISYKRGAQSHALAGSIRTYISNRFGYRVTWDETGIETGADIRAYMNRLAKGSYIIFIVTPEFLRSQFCMYELAATAEEPEFKARVVAIL
jgi:internalin A